MSKRKFKTEVNQLLHLIIHSLYSHPEIFLRELISNASDALDTLKYLTLTEDKYKEIEFDPRIDISFGNEKHHIVTLSDTGKERKVITVSDTGIGMNGKELEQNLGTIARSGTKDFFSSLTGDAKKDSNIIGQFGVGFYSAFMVAERVEVISRKAGEQEAFSWTSDGKGGYEIEEAVRDGHGTTITLLLNEQGEEYANRLVIEGIIKKYSNHIPFPIHLHYEVETNDGSLKKEEIQANSASALWRRSKSELKAEDYNEFYRSISHDTEDPLLHIHTKAEGKVEYTTLFFIPRKAPLDLYWSDYQPGVKLYIKRVFITDDERELLPRYLRFVRGLIDSEDLPLNVSREMLQKNSILTKIRADSVKRILNELLELKKDKQKYDEFYEEFRRPLKEGAYQDFMNRETLFDLLQFKSTKTEGYTGFADYAERIPDDQKVIYYITGENEQSLRSSPLLESFKRREIEVLIMDDDIDEIIIPSFGKYEDFDLKAVNRSDTLDGIKTEEDKKREKSISPLLDRIGKVLKDEVKSVRADSGLSESPSCIVSDENDPTIGLQQILKAMGQKDVVEAKPILEVNPDHPIVKALETTEDEGVFEDVSRLLFEQALLIEGVRPRDAASFVKRLNRVLERALPQH
ncbi:MAG TPA: molecular chaperone HtpG [Spirochaetota bacterium]|nr:molecular chaperone HtpG [Spirochaetota bacterium]